MAAPVPTTPAIAGADSLPGFKPSAPRVQWHLLGHCSLPGPGPGLLQPPPQACTLLHELLPGGAAVTLGQHLETPQDPPWVGSHAHGLGLLVVGASGWPESCAPRPCYHYIYIESQSKYYSYHFMDEKNKDLTQVSPEFEYRLCHQLVQ